MKHSNDTSGLSNDSFPSTPRSPPWTSPPVLAFGTLTSLDTVMASSSGCECDGGGGDGGKTTGAGGGASACGARRGETRPDDGRTGTGGFRCAAGLEARRCSDDERFAAGDADRRAERSRLACRGGGDGEPRALRERTPPPPYEPATAAARSRRGGPRSAESGRRLRAGGFPGGERSGPMTELVATDDSDAASDTSSVASESDTQLVRSLTAAASALTSSFLAFFSTTSRSFGFGAATLATTGLGLGSGLGLAVGVSESTSLTVSSGEGGLRSSGSHQRPLPAAARFLRLLLKQQPISLTWRAQMDGRTSRPSPVAETEVGVGSWVERTTGFRGLAWPRGASILAEEVMGMEAWRGGLLVKYRLSARDAGEAASYAATTWVVLC